MKKNLIILIMWSITLLSYGQSDIVTLAGKSGPTATIGGYHHICAGTQATIPVYLTNGPSWDVTFTDGLTQWTVTGITSSPYQLVVSPPVVRTYTIVSVTAAGCSGTGTGAATVIIDDAPQVFTISCATTNFCAGSTSDPILLNGSEDGVIYTLKSNNNVVNTVIGNDNPIQFPGQTLAGIYSVVASSPTASCTSTMNGNVVLTTNPLPQAANAIVGNNSVCQNATVTYTTTSVIDATTYTWSVPSGATIENGQGSTQISVKFNGNQSGNIAVFAQNSCGAGQPALLAVTVNSAPSLAITGNPSSFCAGTSATLTATGNANAFSWSTGATTQSINVAPTSNMTYSVTTTNSNGCSTIGTITLDVHPLPVVTLNLPETSFCADQGVMALSGGSPAGGVYSGNYVYNNSLVPSATPTGTYPITYTYTDTYGCMGIAVQDATFNSIPAIMFSNIPGPIYTNTPAFYLSGYVSPSGGTFSGPGVSGNIFNPAIAGPGTHMVTYTFVHPTTGCSNTQIQYITVTDSGTNTGVDEVASNSINIFPNPTNETLNLTGIKTQEIISLRVMDLTGRVLYSTTTLEETMQLDVAGFASGSYIICFTNSDGLSITKKFMKQ